MTTNNEESSGVSRPGAFSNFKNMVKIGSDRLKEKFTNLFSKKNTPRNNQEASNEGKSPSNSNTANTNQIAGLQNAKKEDNSEAFKIEDDMENNDLSFHINNEEDDEEEEDVKHSEKVQEESKKDSVNKATIATITKNIPAVHEKMLKEIEESDISTFVHKVYLKGSLIEIEGIPAIYCKKIKKKSKILSFMGFGKNKKEELLNYILVFDDNFIYFIKDENNNPDKSNPKLKKVGNRYNLRVLFNVLFKTSEENSNFKIITLFFSKEEYSPTDSEKVRKDFSFEDNTEQIFMSYLNVFLTKINKPTINL